MPILLLFVIAFGVTLVMALLPHPSSPLGSIWDKYQHMLAFGSLALLATFALPAIPLPLIGERLSFLGAMIEVAQAIPGIHRDCDFSDWIADTAAVVFVLMIVHIATRGQGRAL